MKPANTLALGAAIGLIGATGVQAADLPVKAKPIEYLKVCSLYGAGFFYMPGTDSCIKIGGYVRISTTFNGLAFSGPYYSGDAGGGDRFADRANSRSRFALGFDIRTATEYGVVRVFSQSDFNFNNFGNSNPSAIGAPAAPLGGLNGNLLEGVSGGWVTVEYAFIQFAGFGFGKSASAYATPWQGYPGNNTVWLVGGHDSVTGLNNIQYTAQFGNGVTATIGLDDGTQYNRTPLANLALGVSAAGVGSNAYGGWFMPDVVGNIRVDQAWGMFQLSGALHQVDGSYNSLAAGGAPTTASILSGHPDSKFGGSAMVALQLRNIPTGPGDDIKFDASWAKGDTKNIIGGSGPVSSGYLMLGGVPGQFGPAGSLGFGPTTDGVWLPTASGGDGNIHLTMGYGLRGAFNHNWDPYWSTSLWGGGGWVRYDSMAQHEYCAMYGVTVAGQGATYSCNPNYGLSMVGVTTRWTPVANFTFSAELGWAHLQQSFSGSATFSPGPPQPIQTWKYRNQDTAFLEARVQRNF